MNPAFHMGSGAAKARLGTGADAMPIQRLVLVTSRRTTAALTSRTVGYKSEWRKRIQLYAHR